MNPAQEYILSKPDPFKSILLELCTVIEGLFEDVDQKFKWSIPCYYINNKPFCYLNNTEGYVDLGFWHGAHLSLHLEKLVDKDRSLIKSLRYYKLEEIDHQVLVEVLQEAYSFKGKGIYK